MQDAGHFRQYVPKAIVEGIFGAHHTNVHRAVLPNAVICQHLSQTTRGSVMNQPL